MSGDTIIAMTGLMGLAAAGLAGALWDGPLVTALFRGERVLPVECRHAMRGRLPAWLAFKPGLARHRVPRTFAERSPD
jgi:hypothetical protein